MKIAAFYENIKEGADALGLPVRDALARLKEAGLQEIYISVYAVNGEWETLRPVLQELGLTVEGVFGFCDYAHDPDSQEGLAIIDAAVLTGAPAVLIVPGDFGDRPETRDEVTANIVKGMTAACACGEAHGVRVTMEDFDGINVPYCTAEGLKYFMDTVPGLACSFDTGNFVMYHEDELAAAKLLLDHFCTIHAKDRSTAPVYPGDKGKPCADGSMIWPAPVGAGSMQIEKILRLAVDHGYRGNVIAELFDCNPAHMLEAAERSVRWLSERVEKLAQAQK